MKTSVSFYDHGGEAPPEVKAWIGTATADHSWVQINIGGADITVHASNQANALAWLIKCREALDRAIAEAPLPMPDVPLTLDDEVPF